MSSKIAEIFKRFYAPYCEKYGFSPESNKVANAIMNCKSGRLGFNMGMCDDCGHIQFHNNSCRNRHCPSCQAIPKERWIDARKSEVVDAPYFHVVFTVPHELNDLFFANQTLLYPLFYRCVSETLLELSQNIKYLGAMPGFIQILHTWGQKLEYHPHIHCIVMGGGLTKSLDFKRVSDGFFIPVRVISQKFRGKFLSLLRELFNTNQLVFSRRILQYQDSSAFINALFQKQWIPFIKETFNGSGDAFTYLGRYTHRIAISNSRIVDVSHSTVSFAAKEYQNGNRQVVAKLEGVEFIRRFLLHVLPKGFVKIRSYGVLSNRLKKKKLQIIRSKTICKGQASLYAAMNTADMLLALYDFNVNQCPNCQGNSFKVKHRFHPRN